MQDPTRLQDRPPRLQIPANAFKSVVTIQIQPIHLNAPIHETLGSPRGLQTHNSTVGGPPIKVIPHVHVNRIQFLLTGPVRVIELTKLLWIISDTPFIHQKQPLRPSLVYEQPGMVTLPDSNLNAHRVLGQKFCKGLALTVLRDLLSLPFQVTHSFPSLVKSHHAS